MVVYGNIYIPIDHHYKTQAQLIVTVRNDCSSGSVIWRERQRKCLFNPVL